MENHYIYIDDNTHLNYNTHLQDERRSIDSLFKVETAERLKVIAEKLGNFTVKILAEAGDTYNLADISHRTSNVVVSGERIIPEGLVLVSMFRHSEPPTDLSELWREYEKPSTTVA